MDKRLYEMAIIQNWKETEINREVSSFSIDGGQNFINICRLLEQIEHDINYYKELQERAMHEIANDIKKFGGIRCLNDYTYPPLYNYEYYANFKAPNWE